MFMLYFIFFLIGSVVGFCLGYLFVFSQSTALRTNVNSGLTTSLEPLKNDLARFHQRLEDIFLNTNKEQYALKQEVQRMVEVNQKMTVQTENFTKALRGDRRIQGVWGEMILERVLESSGLRNGEEYVVQGKGLCLNNLEKEGATRPDVVIRLPDKRHIVVDAKVSLIAYERICNADETNARDGENSEDIRAFIGSIKAHITNLKSKNYAHIEELGSPHFVFMFMPIDGAYSLALRHEPTLHSYAWDRDVVLVTPTTLLASLRTIASLWREQRQNNHAADIARRGGMLYDKVAQLVDLVEEMGTHMDRLGKAYEHITHKLSRERGNIIFQIEQLKELGAKTSRKIGNQWLRSDDE